MFSVLFNFEVSSLILYDIISNTINHEDCKNSLTHLPFCSHKVRHNLLSRLPIFYQLLMKSYQQTNLGKIMSN